MISKRSTAMKIINDPRGEKRLYLAVVVDCHPNAMFHVYVCSLRKLALGYVSGKMRESSIRITRGDRVLLELSAYDQTKGRIVRRLDNMSFPKRDDSSRKNDSDTGNGAVS
uniref:InfA n=1 Tax=Thalassia hemprichii TaxID=55496 RepID=A0A4Y1KCL5_9LILI|nr:translational initiation factor 1 [Thalassia hemprichii]YP_009667445.1 translational initiation factor 1 [Thalassia hemprichii]ATP74947.1 translational initiation factor 1 [Thalassia hemprichii]ATP75002.1 translational initiation factor 1 [Thalassia hemprichii]QJR53075.1 InfA [Thalassia hemprichii]QJR53113.1 InfA [Thalassia hemprichii]